MHKISILFNFLWMDYRIRYWKVHHYLPLVGSIGQEMTGDWKFEITIEMVILQEHEKPTSGIPSLFVLVVFEGIQPEMYLIVCHFNF